MGARARRCADEVLWETIGRDSVVELVRPTGMTRMRGLATIGRGRADEVGRRLSDDRERRCGRGCLGPLETRLADGWERETLGWEAVRMRFFQPP